MIITKTPYRISLFGGGTDHPKWFQRHGGQVVGFAISKYIYISVHQPQRFYDHNYRVVYGKTELTDNIEDIEHPVVRAVFKHYPVNGGVDMNYVGELPARAGMGSSSAFTVGLINAVERLRGHAHKGMALAEKAIDLEQNILQEAVGCQDQVWSATGGFNRLVFHKDGRIDRQPLELHPDHADKIHAHMLLFFTGVSRFAHEIETKKVQNLEAKAAQMKTLSDTVDEAVRLMSGDCDMAALGQLLHHGWQAKKALDPGVSSPFIDGLYDAARHAGAYGGKILGAGGGGFLLLIAPPERHAEIRQTLAPLVDVSFSFDHSGSSLVYRPSAP